ncbi:MAG TPA: hypothetical protein VGD65_12670 [Chryseosolibacter sp.]
MKKVLLAFSFVFAGLIAVNAQDTTSTSTQTPQYPTSTSQEDQDRERINSRDLPDAVKRSLEATEYRGWLVNAAYKTTGVNDQAMSSDSSNMSSDSTSVSSGPRSQSDSTSVSGNQNTTGNQNTNTGNQNTNSGNQNMSGAYGQEVFVVELKNGAQTKTVRFDKEGNKLDDEGSENDQK